MAVIQGPFLALVLLLVSRGLQCSPLLPACPVPCLCQRAPLLNCSSSGLSQAPHHIQATVTELDLSHNLLNSITLHQPHHKLRRVWLGNNSITQLSLCVERAMGSHHVRERHSHRSGLRGGQGCVSWAPALQLLSVERNQLVHVPEGAGGSKSLQVLQLSFNRISSLQPGDLSHLWQLEELHLQHNLITSIHSQAFRDLPHLRVLDLSFNLLTSFHPMIYLSLHNIGADVRLSENRWQCDCSMHTLRRWMDYDSKRGQQAWSMVCTTPSTFSGRDLLQLAEEDLICFNAENKPELHQDVTVDRGSEILLSCSTQQNSTWWTPNGQVPVSQPQAGLLISEITERDSGLYVCVSESEQEIVSAFNLQIRKIQETKRKTRIPRTLPKSSQFIIPQGIPHRMGQVRNQTTTQSDLTLAVCLSVFITFLVAFILGVLARPLIDLLCRRVCNKGRSSPKGPVPSAGQRQYDNEAYYSGEEEPEEIGTHRERRVTFSTADFREHGNVPYYDTVASGNQENVNEDAVSECGASKANHQSKKDKTTAGDSGSESSSSEDNEGRGKNFSGVSDPGPTHSMEFEHIPDQVDLERRRSSSSNSDTSLSHKVQKEEQRTQRHSQNPGSLQQLEDPFQPRSKSPTVRSVEVPQIAIDSRSEIPGFSSEPFADWSPNINDSSLMDPDLWQENGEKFEFSDSVQTPSARSSSPFDSFNNSNQIAFPTTDKLKRSDSSSSSSSSHVSGNELTEYTVNPERKEKEDTEMTPEHLLTHDTKSKIAKQGVHFEQQIHDIDPIRFSLKGDRFNQGDYKRDARQPSVGSDSSHSSDSDDGPTQYTFEQETDEEKEGGNKVNRSNKPVSNVVTAGRDRIEEVSPMPWTDLEPEAQRPGLGWGVVHIPHKRPDIKAPSPPAAHSSSSSSDSEAEIADHKVAQDKDRVKVGITSQKPETRLPVLDQLATKAPSPSPDSSSSSESADETTEQEKVDMEGLPVKKSQMHEPETKWPELDLGGITGIKRRLDIKPPSPPSDSSSSSGSEEKSMDLTVKQGREEALADTTYNQYPLNPVSLSPKRAIRISPSYSTSSREELEKTARVDFSIPSTKMEPEPESRWPDLGLSSSSLHIKRRLDIKAPSPPPESSSSSSESEDGTADTIVKLERDRIDVGITSNQPKTKLPDLNLGFPHMKRRLDIKAPSQPDDSYSSSSDSENKVTSQTVKQESERPHVGITSNQPETKLPDLSLRVPHIRRRLDIKAPPQQDDSSSSSSDSENKMTGQTVKQERNRGDVEIKGNQLEAMLPDLSLGVPRIKRRLDIKAPSPEPSPFLSGVSPRPLPVESNSSRSESEDENKAKLEMEIPVVLRRTKKDSGKSLTATPINISGTPKSAYNIKLEKYTVITDELGDKTTTENVSPPPKVNPELESQWAGLHLGISRFRKRLDITSPKSTPLKMPSLPSRESSSSSSESEDDIKSSRGRRKRGESGMKGTIYKESSLTPASQPINDSLNLKNADSIASDKSADAKERLRKDYSFPTTEEKSDPGAIWAGRSVPHVKRYLDIKVTEKDPSTPPLQKLSSHSSSSSESEDEVARHAGKGWKEKSQKPISLYPSKAANISIDQLDSSMDKVEKKGKLDLKSQKSNVEEDPELMWPHLGLSNVPRIKRRLDIKAPSPSPSEYSSSSKSEDDTTDHTVQQERDSTDKGITSPVCETKLPDLSLGIPRVKRYLNVKAPSPQPTDSLSTSDNKNRDRMDLFGITHTQSQLTTHRHLNIKAPSPPGDSSSSSSEDETTERLKQRTKEPGDSAQNVREISASLALSRVPSTSFDDVIKRRIEQARRTQDVDLPSNLLRTGVDRHLSDHSISSPRRRLDVSFQQPKETPPAVPGSPPSDSSSSSSSSSESGDEVRREREKAEITPLHKYSSLSPIGVSLAPSRALDKFDNSFSSTNERVWSATPEDRMQRKGLSALKALSSERKKWDSGLDEPDMGSSPQWNNKGLSFQDATTYYKYEKDTQPIGKLSLPELLLSSAKNERGARALQHPIPHHRRYVVGGIQSPQETLPPVPETPPPEEEVAGPKWRSPLSSETQEWKNTSSYQQQDRGMEGSGPSSPSSISQGDDGKRSPRLIELLGAAPYHMARQYQGLTTTTTQHYEESTVTHTSSSKSYTIQFDSSSMNITDV